MALRSFKDNEQILDNNFIIKNNDVSDRVIKELPYKLTEAQIKVLKEIRQDMSSTKVMNRLVQGDVGCGKTIIAFLSLFDVVSEGYQGALMVPTEVLASQHYESLCELIDKYENLIVVQTFSKARSMAGMRIGYAISNPTLIKYLNDAKYSFNSYTMNQTSLVCGVEAVKDKAYFEEQVQKIIDTREWTKKELRALGFEFPDSQSNFILATHPKVSAKKLFEALKKENIYVRFLSGARIQEYLRISVGTREEMESLISFLKDYLKK